MSRIPGPNRAHRRRGESFGSCLLVIILVLGGAMFAWYKFGKNRSLIKAGDDVLIMTKYSQDADLEYRKHFREHNQGNSAGVRVAMTKFYTDTVKGVYKGKSSDFEQAYYETDQRLLDVIGELDMNQVPPKFVKDHKKLSKSFKYFYECIEFLRQGYAAEGDEQKKLYEQAKGKLTEGLALSQTGETGIRSTMDSVGVGP